MSTDREKVDEILDLWDKRKIRRETELVILQEKVLELELEIETIGCLSNELSKEFSTPSLEVFTPEENQAADEFVAESVQDELESMDS